MSLFWGASPFDELVDKATSELLPAGSSDIGLNLEICDQIRSKSVTALVAMRSIKRRVDHKNPNVQLLALELADTCTKNGGDQFLVQVASREFMDDLVSIAKSSGVNRDVKATILRLIQSWARGMEGKADCSYVGETYKTLKSSGFEFPPLSPAAATATLFQTATAPAWTDSDRCMRCREPFTLTFRKHHCRNCGQTFCQGCSSYTARLDHFGINQEVRVCKPCYEKLTRKTPGDKVDSSKKDVVGSQSWVRKERERTDKDLERAIALSLAEARSNGYALDDPQPSRPAQLSKGLPKDLVEEENDPDLLAAIKASLEDLASAPALLPEGSAAADYLPAPPPPLPSYDLSLSETNAIIDFSEAVESGRPVRELDGLREIVDPLRPKLVRALDDTERKEQVLTDMHSKLAEVVKLFDHHLNAQLERRSSTYHQAHRPSTYASYAPAQAITSPVPAQRSYTADYVQRPQVYGVAATPASYAPQQYAPPQQSYAAPSAAEPQQAYNQQYAGPPPQRQESYVPEPAQQYQQPVSQPQPQQPTYAPPQQEYVPPAQAPYPQSPVQMQAAPSNSMQPTSPVTQMSTAPAVPIIPAPSVTQAAPSLYQPAYPVQQQQLSQPQQPSRPAPASLPHQTSYAPPPPSTTKSYADPGSSAAPNRHAVPQQQPDQARQPVYSPPVYAPAQEIPVFPAAPQNVFPSAFPVAPTEIPEPYGSHYAPAREEKEVSLIEL